MSDSSAEALRWAATGLEQSASELGRKVGKSHRRGNHLSGPFVDANQRAAKAYAEAAAMLREHARVMRVVARGLDEEQKPEVEPSLLHDWTDKP